MLNLTEQNRKADPFARVARLLPHLSSVPLYQDRSPRLGSIPDAECPRCAFSDLPFVTKHEMRENFPGNFLRPGQALESLLEQELVEKKILELQQFHLHNKLFGIKYFVQTNGI